MAPDWVCEVLSPSTSKVDRMRKLPVYFREQVGHVWFVEPRDRTLEVFRREANAWVLVGVYSDDARVRVPPFDALDLDLAVLWADVQPPT